jgi:hypothetical protein
MVKQIVRRKYVKFWNPLPLLITTPLIIGCSSGNQGLIAIAMLLFAALIMGIGGAGLLRGPEP